MISRRDFLQVAAATAAIVPGGWTQALRAAAADAGRAAAVRTARQRHAGARHRHSRPAHADPVPRAVDQSRRRRRKGQVPHITGRDFLDLYNITAGSAAAYALTSEDFAALAKSYGRLGGLDRIATMLKTIRAERGDRVVFLDGGDTWQNSYTSLRQQGPGHGRLHGAAQAGRHGRPLGIHARRRARQGTGRASSAFRSWRRTSATPSGTSRRSTP